MFGARPFSPFFENVSCFVIKLTLDEKVFWGYNYGKHLFWKGGVLVARRKLRFRLRQKPGEKGIFLPESVINSLLTATEAELKLLMLLAREGRDKDYLSESDLLPLCEGAGIDKETFAEAMAFFRGAGLVENEDKAEKEIKPETEKPEPEPILPTPKKKPHPALYTSAQLADVAQTPKFRELVEFAARKLEKTFNTHDLSTLYSFVDTLALPYDVIMLGIEHCVGEGKMSLRYVEKLLMDFADKEIDTYDKADNYIRRRVMFKSFEGRIRTLMGLGQRSLTAREKAMLNSWQTEFCTPDELIVLAYEKTVEKTGKASMSYMNKILENWHTAGFKTVLDVEAGDVKAEPSSGNSSFNLEDFVQVAVARSEKWKKEQNS